MKFLKCLCQVILVILVVVGSLVLGWCLGSVTFAKVLDRSPIGCCKCKSGVSAHGQVSCKECGKKCPCADKCQRGNGPCQCVACQCCDCKPEE